MLLFSKKCYSRHMLNWGIWDLHIMLILVSRTSWVPLATDQHVHTPNLAAYLYDYCYNIGVLLFSYSRRMLNWGMCIFRDLHIMLDLSITPDAPVCINNLVSIWFSFPRNLVLCVYCSPSSIVNNGIMDVMSIIIRLHCEQVQEPKPLQDLSYAIT